jgi:putative cardiolipin synthase
VFLHDLTWPGTCLISTHKHNMGDSVRIHQTLALTFLMALATNAKAERARFLYSDLDALQARVDLIQQAKSEILVEYFAVTDDDVSTTGVALLCEASKRGVQVKILLDALSSSVKDTTIAATQRDCKDKNGNTNITFKLFNRPEDITSIHDILDRVHDKMLAVDGKILIIGGRNVDAKYFGLDKKRNFKDLDILITGNIVQDARKYYLGLWDKNDIVKKAYYDKFQREKFVYVCETVRGPDCDENVDKLYALLSKDVKSSSDRMKALIERLKSGKGNAKWNTGTNWFKDTKEIDGVKLLSNSTVKNMGSKNMNVSDELHSIVSKAKKKVLILSPYMIPTTRARDLFQGLVDRGVKITIITNSLKSTDNLFAQAGYKSAKDAMIEMGIELYEYNLVDTTHAKTAVIDDEIVLIGTYNLDPRSSKLNREVGLMIKDTKGSGLAKELTSIINKFKAQSLLVGKDRQPMNEDLQDAEVGHFKKGAVKIIEQAVPLIKNQL